MRASRLLSILTTLQARGLVTAQALAEQCEVSIRTIYRDVDALSAAGVPVYSDRGSAGGYRLLEGYRTRLNGLTIEETRALVLSGLPGPAAGLGLGTAMAMAQLKLAAGLPSEMRVAAERMRECFHLDAPGWFHNSEEPDHLRQIATAIWERRLIDVRYTSWKGETRRRLEPLSIVLKSGAWYLVAKIDPAIRTYRVSRVLELAVLDTSFQRPSDFDLMTYWHANTKRLEAELHPERAVVRLSATGFRMLEPLTTPYARRLMEIAPPDEEGYRIVTMPVGSLWQASSDLLRFGKELEVLAPAELRARMTEVVDTLRLMYSATSRRTGAGP